MKLEDVAVVIRPRSPWEAIDLGWQMVQTWWRPLYGHWFAITFPIFVLLHIVLIQHLWVPMILMWWGKPIWERVPLFFLSHALFGDTPSLRAVIRIFPGLARKQLLQWLTIRRFDPARGIELPCTQLEGLRGRAERQRRKILLEKSYHVVFWLTTVCVHVELIVYFSIFAILYLFIPNPQDLNVFELMGDDNRGALLLQNLFVYLSFSLVAPFYVASGFSLYINRRVRMEAWDIELAFRRLAKRCARNGDGIQCVTS